MDNNQTSKPEYKEPVEVQQEGTVVEEPIVDIDIDDNTLVSLIERRIAADDKKYNGELKLDTRTKLMRDMWIGNQLDLTKFDEWQVPYQDNIIWQDLEHRISIAAGRMPDFIVTPSNNTQEKQENAKRLERILEILIKNDMVKRLVKDSLRDLHLFLRSAIKVRWDQNRGLNGDIVYELVRPKRYGVEHTTTIPHDGFTSDNAELIYEWLEEPVDLIVSKFPEKKDELFNLLGIVRGTTRQMMAKIRYLECHFTFYKSGKPIEGVCWKYKTLILDKKKDPNYDWEGYERATEQLDEEGQPVVDTIYRNHFDRPRKPYILVSYTNLGESPYDDTSAVEQAIPLQRTVNKRGRQITEISDRAVPKMAFNGKYIQKEQARRVTNDPDEHIWLDGADLEDVRKAVQSIPATPPNPILYQDLVSNRGQIDSKFSTHTTTRGEAAPNESGVSKQITREGDLVTSDDLVSMVVVRIIYELANWTVQLMKLNYDKEHVIKDIGPEGEMVYEELTRDMIDDGIAINVKASTVDKQVRRSEAMKLASQKAIDPYSLFQDLDYPNPKERTKRLLFFLGGQQDGYARYMQDLKIDNFSQEQQPAGGPEGAPYPGQDQQAILDIQRLEAGEQIQPTTQPTPEYIQAFKQYAASGALEQQSPEVQQNFIAYLQALQQMVAGGGAATV